MKKGRFLYQRETYKLKNWYYNGKLVVDRNKDIVRKFRNIPDVLSSQYPGAFLEAIKREDRRISYIDILARMPSKIKIDIGNGLYTEKALYCSTTLLRRSTNFRLRAGILCWARNDVNKAMERFLEENLPQDLKDLNTTFGFRDLTLYEQDMINGQNEWKSPSELEALYDVK